MNLCMRTAAGIWKPLMTSWIRNNGVSVCLRMQNYTPCKDLRVDGIRVDEVIWTNYHGLGFNPRISAFVN